MKRLSWLLGIGSMLACLLAASSQATILSIGSVTTGSNLVVGDAAASATEFRGYMLVDNTSASSHSTIVVGDEALYLGQLNLVGNLPLDLATSMTATGAGSTSNPTVQIGRSGTGFLNISGSARFELSNFSSIMSIGHLATGVGYVTVSDPFTQVSVGQNLVVGSAGTGSLDILDGARVLTRGDSPANNITIGSATSAVGTVVVDGQGSLLYNASNLFVGSAGIGTLRIANGGIVDSDNRGSSSTITVTVGSRGRIELDGGTIIGTNIALNGLISGSGRVRGNVAVDADAFIELAEGDLLRFENSVNNQGSITVDEGDLQFLGSLTNNAQGAFDAPGRITLQDGTVRLSSTLTNNGVIASTRGTNDIHGEITNAGEIVVASNTVAVFHDSVNTTTGTIDILPRGNALFLADATFTSASSLLLALADEGGSSESAALTVGGLTMLSGNLGVSLAGGFVPTLGATYDLIRSAGGISGTFDSVALPTLPASLEFGVIYNADSVQLAIQTATTNIIDGDYNQDGRVDAADYTVWRDTLGLMGLNLAADGNGDGTVDSADYTIWRGNFGLSAGSLAPADTAVVPEPHSAMLAALALFAGVCGRMYFPRSAR